MDLFLAAIEYVIDLGVAVVMPLIIIVLGLVFRVKFTKAFRAGLMVGIAFTGLNLVIGLLLNTISPVSEALVKNYGFTLNSVDVGWPTGATLAWGTIAVPFVFMAILFTNVVMLAFKWTKTMNVDIWNYWHALFIASILYQVTGNLFLAILSAMINMAIVLKLADWTQKDVQEVLGLEGVSLPHIQATSWAIIDYPLNWLIDKIPVIRNISWTTEGIQKKFGILGEPMILGLIIGCTLSAIAQQPIGTILNVGIVLAAVLVLLPRMIALLMEGLMVISEAAKQFMQKRFPDREVFIGLDAAVGIGHPFVISLALIMIPITVLLSLVLPGNTTLPLADLSTLPFFLIFAIIPSRGNLFRGILLGTVHVVVILYLATLAAPLMTELGVAAGLEIPEGATQITNLAIGAQWYTWPVYWLLSWIGGA